MSALDLTIDTAERALLERLDWLANQPSAQVAIGPVVARVERMLLDDPAVVLAWEPVPLELYQAAMPPGILSSWVFILRAGATTGAERHPNSHQRVMSYAGAGDLQTGGDGHWQSHPLLSDTNAPFERRWLSIPPHIWHQAVVGQANWVVVSFHTVLAQELTEERPDTSHAEAIRQQTYVNEK